MLQHHSAPILFPFILNNTTLQSSLNSRTRSPRVPLSLALNRKTNLPGLTSILAYVSDAEHIASNADSSRGAIHPCWQEIERSLPLSCLREGNVWSKAECVKCKCKPLHSSHTFPALSRSIAGLWLGDADPPNRWHVSPTYVGNTHFWKAKRQEQHEACERDRAVPPIQSLAFPGWGSQWKLKQPYLRCSVRENTHCKIKKSNTKRFFQSFHWKNLSVIHCLVFIVACGHSHPHLLYAQTLLHICITKSIHKKSLPHLSKVDTGIAGVTTILLRCLVLGQSDNFSIINKAWQSLVLA